MARNPMKRRELNAGLIGFLIAAVIMGAVVAVVVRLYSKQKDEFEALQARHIRVLVAKETIESGTKLDESMFGLSEVMTDVDSSEYYENVGDLLGEPRTLVDEEGNELDEKEYSVGAKFEIPKGTIVTKNMFTPVDDVITDDVRLQEYSCIALPSQLKAKEFVDIRFALPSGQDYIVLSRKQIEQTNADTIWIKVNEVELLQLNSVMVESWTIAGSKLYAIEYVDAGMQAKASLTYKPSYEVMELMNGDPNVVNEAYKALSDSLKKGTKYTTKIVDDYRAYIDEALTEYIDGRDSAASAGYADEISKMQSRRQEYIEALGEESSESYSSSEEE